MTEKDFVTKFLTETKMTRRSFLKWSAALGGASVLAGGGIKFGLESTEKAAAQAGYEIVPTGCSHNCGGRCVLKAWVKDGTIERITTDDRPDGLPDPQLRACVRGHSYRRRVYHPDRLKYPMRRVGNRGDGKFERISWDEAVDIAAKEMTRIHDKYGPASMYNHYASGGGSFLLGSGASKRLLNLMGGQLNYHNTYSTACTSWATPYSYGTSLTGNSRDSFLHSKLILLWSFNGCENIFGTNTMYYLKEAKNQGAKIIVIDPRMSMTAIGLADEWVPVHPGTDNALMDAMAYVMIDENLLDQAFLDKYCLGFDEAHMPEDVPAGNSFKSYVMGDSDGQPKTPEWAEAITQIPKEQIVDLARQYATLKPAALVQGWGMQRRAFGEQPVRGGITLAAMTGNIGILGGWASGSGYYGRGPKVGSFPSGDNPIKVSIPVFLWTEAITRGTEMGPQDGLTGGDSLPSNIKFIYNCAGDTLINQHGDVNRTDRILRDTSLVEFILVHDQFMCPSAKYADLLLPVTTWMEKNDLCTTWVWGDSIIYMNKVIDPLYECKTDYEICAAIAEKLGLGDEYTQGRTEEDWIKEFLKTTEEAYPDFPGYDEFKKKGVFVALYDQPSIAFEDFRKDPVANPLGTPSGKIEIFSKQLWDMNIENLPAIPKYIPEEKMDPEMAKFPLSAMGHHFQRRSHSTYDNIDWLDEAMPQRIFMNEIDAKARGIRDGDRVRVYNNYGEMIIPARVNSRIKPGVVDIPEGGWWTPDKNGVDQRGCVNVLTTWKWTPGAKGNPQHTIWVEVEKA